ncbi:MAG: gliding motility-associated C-terminal domain-containing protein, partial [Bacteroidetes bacterium]|nr:gliding motility-associated C-terminal domain-containing protein [Bacteroidota bacterium]MBI3143585.1 gliding motility-associated C-terminal domain-containing protein [Bacteroidota bacterium]
SEAEAYTVKVFDRWGQRMWETDDMEAAWDGTHNGLPCTPDVYLYVVRVRNAEGTEYEFTGTITLLR